MWIFDAQHYALGFTLEHEIKTISFNFYCLNYTMLNKHEMKLSSLSFHAQHYTKGFSLEHDFKDFCEF